MTKHLRYALWALLVGSLPSCDGTGSGDTCVAKAITYTGTESGAAYLRILSTDGGQALNFAGNSPSIQVLMAAENSTMTCFGGGAQIDIPVTATVWIDASGAEAATCSDQHNAQCQPSPTDPQAHQSVVLRHGQTTVIHLDIVDPPP